MGSWITQEIVLCFALKNHNSAAKSIVFFQIMTEITERCLLVVFLAAGTDVGQVITRLYLMPRMTAAGSG